MIFNVIKGVRMDFMVLKVSKNFMTLKSLKRIYMTNRELIQFVMSEY
jgi:hypothetical protein